MSRDSLGRLLYLALLLIALVLWVAAGDFDAVEAPYVRF